MNSTNTLHPFEAHRTIITRIYASYIILCLLYKAWCHILPAQLSQPEFTKVGIELTLALYKVLGVGKVIVENRIGSIIFTILLFVLPAMLIWKPKNRWLGAMVSMSFLLMFLSNSMYIHMHQRLNAFMLLMTIPLFVKSDRTFSLLWEGLRYYACWIYGSAFILKIVNGAMLQWDYGFITTQEQMATYIYLNPDTFRTAFLTWTFQHPYLLNIGSIITFLAEGLFILGFFTRKYDRLLLLAGLFIFICTMISAGVFFIEQLGALILIFLNTDDWQKITRKLPMQLAR
jgi:hypothetical protein